MIELNFTLELVLIGIFSASLRICVQHWSIGTDEV